MSSASLGSSSPAPGLFRGPMLRRLVVILALCWLAFGLRLFRLGTQSLWYDEGLSVYLAGLPPINTIQTSAITDHPPLHALMLGVWMQAAGQSEFAVRFLSLWWSVLAVALTWRLGRELLAEAIGAVGAGLLAVSALAVWYAQETRGYSLLLALTLIMAWAFARLHRQPGPRHGPGGGSLPIRQGTLRLAEGDNWAWVALIASSLAALYTHYYAAFTLLALNLAFLAMLACRMQEARSMKQGTQGARDTRPASCSLHLAARFWFSQLVILAGFAPWLPSAIHQATTNVTYFPGRVGWQTVVSDTLRAFATGDVAPTLVAAWAVGAMGVLAVVGAFAEQPGTTRLNRVVVTLLVAAPVAAMVAIAWNRPKFAPRYLIEALPAFYLMVGAGLTATGQGRIRGWTVSVRRGFTVVCVMILLATSALSLRATYFDPVRQRPDVRGVTAYIGSNERPGDVIVLLSGHQLPVFEHYYGRKNPLISMPNSLMPPAQSPLDYGAASQLNDIAYRHDRLWLVLWQRELADPTDVVLNELLTQTRRLGVGRDFHEISLMLFDVQGHQPLGDGPQHPVKERFAEPIALVGYDLDAAPRAPGESIDLALYWQASGSIAGNYQVFTHLVAPGGNMVGGSDHIAGADNYPTSLWTNGTLIRNNFTLRVPPDALSGTYGIEVGLYDSQGRLKLTNGTDRILLTEIVVK